MPSGTRGRTREELLGADRKLRIALELDRSLLSRKSGRFSKAGETWRCPDDATPPDGPGRVEAARSDTAESHHLRESGAMEQDSDVVLLVRWPWKAKPDTAEPKETSFAL